MDVKGTLKQAFSINIPNLDQFANMPALTRFIHQHGAQKEATLAGNMTPEDWDNVKRGAVQVFSLPSGWSLWKVPKGNTDANALAANLLCHQKKHGTSWCVGRPGIDNMVRDYLNQGDFFVFQKNGHSKYAVSTNGNERLTIWAPSDAILFDSEAISESANAQLNKLAPNVTEAFVELSGGETLTDALAVIPNALKEPIKVAQSNPTSSIFNKVPAEYLNAVPIQTEKMLYRIVHTLPASSLIGDINRLVGYDKITEAYSLLLYVVNPLYGKVLTNEELELFEVESFLVYMEAHCNSNDRKMPKQLEAFIVAHMPNS